MSDQELRAALHALTAPDASAPPPDARELVLAGVGRRRRRARMALASGMALGLAGVLGLGWLWWPPGGESPDPGPAGGTGTWEPIAESPLAPRDGVISVWTGTEMLVVGGVNWWCPPGASCVEPAEEDLFHDGAAYDPATDTWRELPGTDHALWHGLGAWTGQELVVVTRFSGDPATLALDPAAGSWRELTAPPSPLDYVPFEYVLWAGDRLVFWTSDDSYGSDWSLDPESGEWTALPADPFGPTFDRSFGWTGTELVLSAQLNDQDYPGSFHVATLDLETGQWEVWPTSSPVTFWAQEWFVFDGHWVNATQGAVTSQPREAVVGAVDLATKEWVDVPQATDDDNALMAACQLPPLGASGDWLAAGGGALLSLDPSVAILTPPCDPIERPTAAVWTGEELIVWGGITRAADPAVYDPRQGTTGAGFRWSPPSPESSVQ